MKMENINIHDLLTAYMKQCYAGKTALVIFVGDTDSQGEFNTLMNELNELGLAPPNKFRSLGFLIIEMQQALAKKLINQHNKGFIRMELYSNGECVNEIR